MTTPLPTLPPRYLGKLLEMHFGEVPPRISYRNHVAPPNESCQKGKRRITAAAVLDLADVLGTSPKLWMNLQATYDLDKAAKARHVA